MTSELITFTHLRCHSSSTALGTRTGYWKPTRRGTDETPLWGWKKYLWFLPLWIISLKYEGCWWKKFSMHTFIHWHPSERMFPHFMRKKGLGRRFAPVCFQYWTFIGIDAITRPNLFILPTLWPVGPTLAYGGSHICEHKWFNKKLVENYDTIQFIFGISVNLM